MTSWLCPVASRLHDKIAMPSKLSCMMNWLYFCVPQETLTCTQPQHNHSHMTCAHKLIGAQVTHMTQHTSMVVSTSGGGHTYLGTTAGRYSNTMQFTSPPITNHHSPPHTHTPAVFTQTFILTYMYSKPPFLKEMCCYVSRTSLKRKLHLNPLPLSPFLIRAHQSQYSWHQG